MAETRRVPLRWVIAIVTLALAAACDGTRTVSYRYRALPGRAGQSAAEGGSGDPQVAGAVGRPDALGGAGEGGAPGRAGAGSSSGESSAAGEAGALSVTCTRAEDCGAPSDCAIPRCHSGSCSLSVLPQGTFVRFTAVACHAVVCDGSGSAEQVVDTRNLPGAAPDCRLSSCANDGSVQVTLAPPGTSCGSNHAQRCDAVGACVDCLAAADCRAGQVCASGQCQNPAASCANHHRDGSETDIDCGGSCSPCAIGADCYRDSDCATQACDFYAPGRCLVSHCSDRHRNADETDVDCGGTSCGPCQATAACSVDSDCSSGLCHNEFHFCLADHCSNGVQDGGETGLDCGGGCYGCSDGNACVSNADCLASACDALSLTCVADHCQDHHRDGDETDSDCGGSTCVPCASGKKCNSSPDCAPGLTCPASAPKVCY